jgi:hypothetical protein
MRCSNRRTTAALKGLGAGAGVGGVGTKMESKTRSSSVSIDVTVRRFFDLDSLRFIVEPPIEFMRGMTDADRASQLDALPIEDCLLVVKLS